MENKLEITEKNLYALTIYGMSAALYGLETGKIDKNFKEEDINIVLDLVESQLTAVFDHSKGYSSDIEAILIKIQNRVESLVERGE